MSTHKLEIKSKKDLSSHTLKAIEIFEKICKLERQKDELEIGLNFCVSNIPRDEFHFYVSQTSLIEKREEDKHYLFLKKNGLL